MDKSKALMLGIVLILILVVGFFGFREAISPTGNPGEPCLQICEWAHCSGDAEDVYFSKNPPYFVGEKYFFWIKIKVLAVADVTDVVVYDELGEEFMVEGVSFVPIDKPGPYDYTFDYVAYEAGGGVTVTDGTSVATGYLDEDGVPFNRFVVYWTNETLKAHFEWNIGSMAKGDAKEVYLTISTDTNPAGEQEFALPGNYFLNYGSTVEGIVESTGTPTSAKSNFLNVEVFEKIE